MNRVPFDTSDDWPRHPELLRAVPWRTGPGDDRIMFEADVGDAHWSIRLNDFPSEPCFTVLINSNELMHFNDWPSFWSRPQPPLRGQAGDNAA
jgi:hypothetical protein